MILEQEITGSGVALQQHGALHAGRHMVEQPAFAKRPQYRTGIHRQRRQSGIVHRVQLHQRMLLRRGRDLEAWQSDPVYIEGVHLRHDVHEMHHLQKPDQPGLARQIARIGFARGDRAIDPQEPGSWRGAAVVHHDAPCLAAHHHAREFENASPRGALDPR